MFQAIGLVVVTIFALYGAFMLGWLPAELAAHLPYSGGISVEAAGPQGVFNALSPDEKTFTERVTGEPNPYK